MTKITLNNIANLIDATTAVNTINANNSTVQTAMDNTVSRDGTQPNSMNASLDMNSNQILNLPAPTSNNSPLRLSDLSLFNSGGSIVAIPTGGNAGDALVKNSNINYDIKWGADSGLLTGGTNIAITGTSPAVVSTIASPTFSHITAEGVTSTGATGTGNLVFSNSPTLSNVPISSLANQAAWTFLVNNTSGAAGPTAQTIDGLTLKTSPVAGDEVIIWDVAGAMLKKATVAGIGTTSGVSSIAGNVGAFTLNYPISNSTNAIVYAGPTNSGQLTFTSTTALAFKPYNGDTIKINGTIFQIPSAGIAGLGSPISVFLNGVAGQSLVAATTYFIYAFNNSGTITADFSTTGHSSSATAGNIGVEIKTGDDTRSLIGMVRTGATVVYADDIRTASWFNRRRKTATPVVQNFTTSTSANSTAIAFVTWAEEAFTIVTAGDYICNTPASFSFQNRLDAGLVGAVFSGSSALANAADALTALRTMTSTEGNHSYDGTLTGPATTSLIGESFVEIRG